MQYLRALIETIRNIGLENAFKRYYSSYPATVVSNADPQKRGRITVKIPQLFGDEPLPSYVTPKDFRDTGEGYGEFYPPYEGDTVWVEFEHGDPLYPIYSGGSYAEGELPEEFTHEEGEAAEGEDEAGQIPKVRGIKTKHGHLLLFDEVEGKERITIKAPYGHQIILDEEVDKQKIRVETAGHLFVLDDTPEKESIYMIHKLGNQIQLNEKGDVNIASVDGNYISMNAEKKEMTLGTGQASVVAMSDKIVASDGSGKSVVSIEDSKIQVTTSGDCIVQSNTATVDSGAITMQSKGDILLKGPLGELEIAQTGEINLKNAIGTIKVDATGKIGIGGPAAELLDLLDQFLDAFINQAQLVMTGVGPSSPLLPPALTSLIQIKILLQLIKGSV